MIRMGWSFWVVLILFIDTCLKFIEYSAGYKSTISFDGNLTNRLSGMAICIIMAIILAITLGWL